MLQQEALAQQSRRVVRYSPQPLLGGLVGFRDGALLGSRRSELAGGRLPFALVQQVAETGLPGLLSLFRRVACRLLGSGRLGFAGCRFLFGLLLLFAGDGVLLLTPLLLRLLRLAPFRLLFAGARLLLLVGVLIALA